MGGCSHCRCAHAAGLGWGGGFRSFAEPAQATPAQAAESLCHRHRCRPHLSDSCQTLCKIIWSKDPEKMHPGKCPGPEHTVSPSKTLLLVSTQNLEKRWPFLGVVLTPPKNSLITPFKKTRFEALDLETQIRGSGWREELVIHRTHNTAKTSSAEFCRPVA